MFCFSLLHANYIVIKHVINSHSTFAYIFLKKIHSISFVRLAYKLHVHLGQNSKTFLHLKVQQNIFRMLIMSNSLREIQEPLLPCSHKCSTRN